MSLAESLYRLQQLDGEIQATRAQLEEIERALADSPAVAHARAECARLEQALRAASTELKLRELDAQALAEKITHEEQRLYGGAIRSPKEILDVERELEALRRRREALDETLLNLMEQVEQLQSELQQCRAALREAERHFAEDSAALRAQQATLQRALEALEERRQALVEHLSADVVQQYEALRARKGNKVAVALLRDSICTQCGQSVPSQLAQQARIGAELAFCPNCGRILYSP